MSIDTDYATLREVLANHGEHYNGGWAAEFGVYSGYSLAIIAEHMPVIGFDSFEGLPEDWREGFPKGEFNQFGDLYHLGAPKANQMIVPGWFSDTLPDFPFPPLSLVHIDCDLYSSTVTALEAVTPYVDVNTVLVFDEYHSYPGAEEHEEKAFYEWRKTHRITCEEIARGAEEAAFVIHDIGEA